ncbi:MAG: extracellular solute-binding protein [Treponema sp.]|jgi:putative aldouronate transport system substrate-binding protein|nr:extracellular solute-binding protein [Treponema sp.]
MIEKRIDVFRNRWYNICYIVLSWRIKVRFNKSKSAILCSLILVAALLAVSCQKKPAASTGAASGGIVKPEVITVMGTVMAVGDEVGGLQFRQQFEKLTGIKLEFIKPIHNQYDQSVQLVFQSNDIPDIIEPPAAPIFVSLAVNGALHDLTDLYYASPITNGAHLYVVDTIKIGGRLYAVPGSHGNGCLTFIRQDWLDQLGLAMPTNWDEFYNVMVQFRDRNPAGAGQRTIPFIAAGVMDPMYTRDFYPGRNTQPGFYIKDNKIVEGMYEADTLTGFRRLAQAYREGLLDQECITFTTSAMRDKFYTGNVGMCSYWAGTWNEQLQNNLEINVPTAKVEPMPPIRGTILIDRPAAEAMAIPSASNNPAGLFKYYIETALDRGPGQLLFTHGVEGVHWTREGGQYRKLPQLDNPAQLSLKTMFNAYITAYPWDDPFPWTDLIRRSTDIFTANAQPDRLMTPDPSITTVMAELSTARAELVARIVMGTITPEDGVAQYRRQYDRQVQECLTILNKNLN